MRSLRAAVSFLTVLPVANRDGSAGARLGRAYFPAIGALVGLAAGLVFVLGAAIFAPLVAAAVAVAALTLLTGALHLDGLADAADGLLARGDKARRLEVMRDPRLGSYGVAALVVALVLQVATIASMPPGHALVGLVIAGALSRMAALGVIALVPYVRAQGLGTAPSSSERRGVDLAVGAATALMVSALDWRRAAVAAVAVAACVVTLVVVARRRVGGATGDVLGATVEISQLAVLLVFAAQSL